MNRNKSKINCLCCDTGNSICEGCEIIINRIGDDLLEEEMDYYEEKKLEEYDINSRKKWIT